MTSLRKLQKIFARHVVDPVRNPIHTTGETLWNSIIHRSCEAQQYPEFLFFYRFMLSESVCPDRSTFLPILRTCAAIPGLSKLGESMHCQVLKMGFVSDRFLLTGLLDLYSKAGSLDSAERVFFEMPERDVVAHNAMITALASRGRVGSARDLFESMPEKNSSTWNSMTACFCRCGDLETAWELFNANPIKDVVSFNTMIDGYCKLGQLTTARELFDRMGSAKNSVTWNTLITGYLHHREFNTAIAMFREMQEINARPTEVTMISLLSACAHLGALDMGKWIHRYIRIRNFKIHSVLGNALIDMYSKCACLGLALDVFDRLPDKNTYCWNSVITGLGMHGHGKEALAAFDEMVKWVDHKPDGVTFVGLLSACTHSGLVDEGRKYFGEMRGVYGIEPAIEHYGCMVDLFGRSGLLKEALCLIETMSIQPNCVVWGSLLRASRIHKDIEISQRVIQALLELDPSDGGNFVFLSNVYASTNRWSDVETCRRIMVERGVRKTPGCSSIELYNTVYEFVAGDLMNPHFVKISAFLFEMDEELRKLGYQPTTDSVLHDIEEEEREHANKYHSERIAIAFGLFNTMDRNTPIRITKNLSVCVDCHEATKYISQLFRREIVVRDRSRFHHFRDGFCSCNGYW